ncbi:MAG: hypothetical protein NDI82_01545 [Anaeromyxobacteraceae bacterium]|nr:hypothetical protein [Anaeromyxobacteraceae bacterium]
MLSRLAGFPLALTAVREFHRLASRWHRDGVISISEARRLSSLRRQFEPGRRSGEEDWSPLLIVDRRPVVVAAAGGLARGELVAFALRVALLRVAIAVEPGERVKLAIPRRPDGRWHRFHAEVIREDLVRGRITVRFLGPVGEGGEGI